MNKTDKQELYQLIDNCNNDFLLTEVKQLLQSATAKDWWDELSEEDQKLLMESEAQYQKGDFISHNELMQQFEAWKKEIVWTTIARKDFWQIVEYLADNWPQSVLEKFSRTLNLKVDLLQKHSQIGFKSSKYSRFRRTLITKHYILIYAVDKDHIIIHGLRHTSRKK